MEVRTAKIGGIKMSFGQIEREGMDQDLGSLWWWDYWDAVYSGEEKRWELGEESEEENFDIAYLQRQVAHVAPDQFRSSQTFAIAWKK
jgi:hypothetical protein